MGTERETDSISDPECLRVGTFLQSPPVPQIWQSIEQSVVYTLLMSVSKLVHRKAKGTFFNISF